LRRHVSIPIRGVSRRGPGRRFGRSAGAAPGR
jgi:hypothetical protein